MIYRENPKNGDKLSQLAFGCMRFPRKGAQINREKTTEMVASAVERGVNYFDTAYIYPGSEDMLGEALAETGYRNRVKVATKLPLLAVKKGEDFDRMFDKQLERLRTDHIDYYLMHMLGDTANWNRLQNMGIEEWIERRRSEGSVRNIGFSFHGGRAAFRELVDAYDWDFTMIQFNYLDENNQAGYGGLRYAREKGLAVFVMEPLRGGLLVNGLPEAAKAAFQQVNRERSLADWALRWVLHHGEVVSALSGMSTMEQLDGNLKTACEASPGGLSDAELEAYGEAVRAINHAIKVPCTGCGYCLPCPRGVDIPTCFSSYNDTYTGRYWPAAIQYYNSTGGLSAKQSDASRCTRCGVCEAKCPQGIHIREELGNVRRRTHSSILNPIFGLVRKGMRIGTR